jgi:hypothetical protein
MTETAPEAAPAVVTPGQADWEARRDSSFARAGLPVGDQFVSWHRLSAEERADSEAGAQAALKRGVCPHGDLAAQSDKHRKRLAMLLADTPFEFRPDWAPEYEGVDVGDGLVAIPQEAAPAAAADSGTALYLSAIARLSAGLREVQRACDRGDAAHAITPLAASALADVDRLQLPQPTPTVTVDALAAVLDGRELLVTGVHSASGDSVWLATPARPRDLAVHLLSAIDMRLTDDPEPEDDAGPSGASALNGHAPGHGCCEHAAVEQDASGPVYGGAA